VQTTQCHKCQMALIDPTARPTCGHPQAILIERFGYTPAQADAWAAVLPMSQIVGA
jgi:hypothetical protein